MATADPEVQIKTDGLSVDFGMGEANVGKQFKAAAAMGAQFAVVFGPDEWAQGGRVTIKDLGSGAQEQVDVDKVVTWVKDRKPTDR